MSEEIVLGRPMWLSAYPNEGTLDYFGFRFYRQPLRSFLVRGAAANDFKNAKTLIYFGAITYAFRIKKGLDAEVDLTEDLKEEWKKWFQVANYLYVVGCFEKHNFTPDRGFTGAIEETQKYFVPFLQSGKEEYKVLSCRDRFYPPQREWGYLSQFWRPPLNYFRSVIDIGSCRYGEYAKDCYNLLSQYEHWDTFIKVLESGVLTKLSYGNIFKTLDCIVLSQAEKALAKRILFDEDKFTQKENDEYKKNYLFVNELITKPFQGYYCKDKNDIAMAISYMHLKDISVNTVDTSWKILVSSLMFEIGICRFYTLISQKSNGDSISSIEIKKAIKESIERWDIAINPSDSVSSVVSKWRNEKLPTIQDFSKVFSNLLDHEGVTTFIDGVIAGYIVSQNVSDKEKTDVYEVLTDNYHHFAPQAFFRQREINPDASFESFIEKVCIAFIEDQYEFSLDRMSYGQKAKFILVKSEYGDEYIYQIDNRGIYENRGVVEMIDACIMLWKSAGV
jgi:hypothetical protein